VHHQQVRKVILLYSALVTLSISGSVFSAGLPSVRDDHIGESPAKVHKDDLGSGASVVGGKAETWDCPAWKR